jgi:hypothetical protein
MSSFNELLHQEIQTIQAILLNEVAILSDDHERYFISDCIHNYAINLCIELEYRIPERQLARLVEEVLDYHYGMESTEIFEEIDAQETSWVEFQLSEINHQFDLALSQH